MRSISFVVAMTIIGTAVPLAASHAQSTSAKVEQDAHIAWNQIKGAWTQSKGEVKENWGKLTDNDVQEIDGRREVLVGKIEVRYAVSHEEAERQVGAFETKKR